MLPSYIYTHTHRHTCMHLILKIYIYIYIYIPVVNASKAAALAAAAVADTVAAARVVSAPISHARHTLETGAMKTVPRYGCVLVMSENRLRSGCVCVCVSVCVQVIRMHAFMCVCKYIQNVVANMCRDEVSTFIHICMHNQ